MLLLALSCLVVALPARADGEDVETIVAHLAFEPGRIDSLGANRVPLKPDPPKGLAALPAVRTPRYSRIVMAGTRGLLIAMDARPEGPRLWVDHNMDGQLRDEKRVWMRKEGNEYERDQTVLISYEGDERPTPVSLHFTYRPKLAIDSLMVRPNVHRRGRAVLGGRLRLVALCDNTSDLRFDHARDTVFVDLNGNGTFDTYGADDEQVKPDVAFRVGDEGWIAKRTDASGRTLTFVRAAAVPDAKPRKWQNRGVMSSGRKTSPPDKSLAELKQLFEKEKKTSKSFVDRYDTVREIGRVGTDDAFRVLKRIADADAEKYIRQQAIQAMGYACYLKIGGSAVMGYAGQSDANIQNAAVYALQGMGHPDRARVYEKIVAKGEATAVRSAAMYLAGMRTDGSRKAILDAYKSRKDVREALYGYGLRYLKGGPPMELMLEAARSNDRRLRLEVLEDLHDLRHPLTRDVAIGLAEDPELTRFEAREVVTILGMQGDPKSVEALLAMLEREGLDEEIRSNALDALRFIRAPKSVAAIVKAVDAKSPALRAVAAEVLAGIPHRDVTKALLKRAKKEKDPDARAAQLEALGDHDDPAAVPLLLKFAKKKASKDPVKDAPRQAAIRALARVGMGDDKARAFLLKLLTSKRRIDRILALDAARASGQTQLCKKVAPSLRHDEWQVRLAAIQAIEALRCKSGIEPLIDRLENEDVPRIRDAIADALFRLTGQPLYDNPRIWRDWWNKNQATFEVPVEIPERVDSDVGGTGAGFYGIPVKTERVVFVIDQSGSMSSPAASLDDEEKERLNQLDVAVREVLGAIGKLNDRARVNVVMFHTTIHPWKDKLQKLSSRNRGILKKHLLDMKPTGGTNLYDGVELALLMDDVDTIFVLSDGAPGSGKFVTTPDILRGVRRLNQSRRIAIHCVSIGRDSDLLERLAAANGGKYVRR